MDRPPRAELDEARGHLAPTGVLDANEQHLGLLLGDESFGLPERLESLAGEAVGEHRDEDIDLRLAEQVDRLGDVACDRLARERSGELVLQCLGGLLDVLSGDGIEHLGHCGLLSGSSASFNGPTTAAMTMRRIVDKS